MDFNNLSDEQAQQLSQILSGITEGSANDEFFKDQLAQAQALREGLMGQHSYGAVSGLANGLMGGYAMRRQMDLGSQRKAGLDKMAGLQRDLYGMDIASRRAGAPPDAQPSAPRYVFPSDSMDAQKSVSDLLRGSYGGGGWNMPDVG